MLRFSYNPAGNFLRTFISPEEVNYLREYLIAGAAHPRAGAGVLMLLPDDPTVITRFKQAIALIFPFLEAVHVCSDGSTRPIPVSSTVSKELFETFPGTNQVAMCMRFGQTLRKKHNIAVIPPLSAVELPSLLSAPKEPRAPAAEREPWQDLWLHFTLQTFNFEQNSALSKLAAALHVPVSAFHFAGTKDKVAVSKQLQRSSKSSL